MGTVALGPTAAGVGLQEEGRLDIRRSKVGARWEADVVLGGLGPT